MTGGIGSSGRGLVRLCAAALLAICIARPACADDPLAPRRIVSLNLCADELVLRLADRGQIAAVTWLAADPRGSTVAAQAAGLPVTRGLSEEILALRPDLVIAGTFTTRTTVAMLKRIGFSPLELGVPSDFDGVRAQIRQVAAAVGHPDRGEAMVAAMDARLAAIAPSEPAGRPRALVMRPNAFTVAPGSLGDAIIRAAGLANAGAEIGQDRSGQVPLEAAALADPDILILDEAAPGTPSLADALPHHPVLRAFAARGRALSIPNRLWTCPGPQVAEVVERLAAARGQIEKRADAAATEPLTSAGEGGPRSGSGEGPALPYPDRAAIPSPDPRSREGHPPPQRGEGYARARSGTP